MQDKQDYSDEGTSNNPQWKLKLYLEILPLIVSLPFVLVKAPFDPVVLYKYWRQLKKSLSTWDINGYSRNR